MEFGITVLVHFLFSEVDEWADARAPEAAPTAPAAADDDDWGAGWAWLEILEKIGAELVLVSVMGNLGVLCDKFGRFAGFCRRLEGFSVFRCCFGHVLDIRRDLSVFLEMLMDLGRV